MFTNNDYFVFLDECVDGKEEFITARGQSLYVMDKQNIDVISLHKNICPIIICIQKL